MSARNARQWVILGGFVVVLGALMAVGLRRTPPLAGVGLDAPNFTARHLGTGDTVALAAYRGQVILLNLWATWCRPCEAEMPAIERLYQELGPLGLRVLAVSVDEGDSEPVKQWAAARGLSFDILHDATRDIERRYHTFGLPESFVIDREGRIVKRVTGFILEWDAPQQKALFRRLLERDAPSSR
jgi:peroxiredoxin